MTGTPVLSLPSSHTGGELLIEHSGKTVAYRASATEVSVAGLAELGEGVSGFAGRDVGDVGGLDLGQAGCGCGDLDAELAAYAAAWPAWPALPVITRVMGAFPVSRP